MNGPRTHGAHSAINDELPDAATSPDSPPPSPPGGGLGSHRSDPPWSGATQDIDVRPCRGAFQVQKTDAARAPVRHQRFVTAEDAAGRLLAAGQGDSFDILQVVARVTRHPGPGA